MLALASPATAVTTGTDVTYTTDAEFDQGSLVNVNHDAPNNNQLQLNVDTSAFRSSGSHQSRTSGSSTSTPVGATRGT